MNSALSILVDLLIKYLSAIALFQESLSPGLVDKSRLAFTQYSQLVMGLQALAVHQVHYLYCLLLDYYRFDNFHLMDSHRRWIRL